MKIYIIILSISFSVQTFSQASKTTNNKISKSRTAKNTASQKASDVGMQDSVKRGETITDKYLSGDSITNTNTDASARKKPVTKSPFVGGVHAAPGAGEKFDTSNNNINNINNVNNVNNTGNNTVAANPIAAPNDTVFNVNAIPTNSVPTTSGAVDRSGQAQFGQTNWGNSRRTVGESQWTVPPPVTASFSKEFPTAASTTWSRNTKDTSLYSVRYKARDNWVTTNYNATGQRLDMRTEVPVMLLPQNVRTCISKMPSNLPVTTVSRWQVLGKADVYEVQTRAGKTIYVNNEGAEVNY